MKGRLLLAVGIGVGYVLGSRAGRQSYESLARCAQDLWGDPRVRARVSEVEDSVKEKAPAAQDKAEQVLKAGGEKSKKVGDEVKAKITGDSAEDPMEDSHG